MKRKALFLMLAILSVFVIFSACEQTEKPADSQEAVKKFAEIKVKLSDFFGKDNEVFNPGFIYGHGMSFFKKGLHLKSDKDSLGDGDGDDWNYDDWTCADVKEYVDDNGNYVLEMDYGDEGCDEYGVMVSGKITYIWKDTDTESYFKVIYDNLRYDGTIMNGFSEGVFAFDSDQYSDSLCWGSGSSEMKDDLDIILEDGTDYKYTSNYKDLWNDEGYTITEGDFYCKSNKEGWEYTYTVKSPLFYKYGCDEDVYVPVSGVEESTYIEGETVYNFIIDYGEGECDNIAMVTENGETYEVDFSDYWDDCFDDTDNTDSVSTK